MAPRTVCTVSVVAGTDNIALERGPRRGERSGTRPTEGPARVRGQDVSGADRLRSDRSLGVETGRPIQRSGWWLVDRRPIEMDLSGQPEWLNGLLEMSKRRGSLGKRVSGSEWTRGWTGSYFGSHRDLAHQSCRRSRSAMESLLVPEDSVRKAGAVTVGALRSMRRRGRNFLPTPRYRPGHPGEQAITECDEMSNENGRGSC